MENLKTVKFDRRAVLSAGSRVLLFFAVIVSGFSPLSYIFAQDALPEVIYETEDSLDSFDNVFDELKRERDALREEIYNLKIEQNSLIEDVRHRVDAAEEEKQRYQQALDTAEVKITELKEEKETLTGRLEDIQVQIDDVQGVINGKNRDIAEAKNEKAELEMEFDQAETALQKAAKRIKNLEAENESLNRELESMRQEQKRLLFGNDEEIRNLRKARVDFIARLKTAQKNLDFAQKKLSRTEMQKESLTRKYEEEIAKLKEREEGLQQQIEEMRSEDKVLLNEYRKKVDKLIADIKKAELNIRELERVNRLTKDKMQLSQGETEVYKSKISLLQEQNQALENKYRRDVVSSTEALQSLKEEFNYTKDKLRFTSDKLEITEEKLTAAKSDLKNLSQETGQTQDSVKQLQEEARLKDEKLESARDNIKLLEIKVKTLSDRLLFKDEGATQRQGSCTNS